MITKTKKKIVPGSSTFLGVTLAEDGANFAIYSKHAREIFLLLFALAQADPTDVIALERSGGDIWSVFVYGVRAGQLYGYKVRGDYRPQDGMRFNEHKLLIDPYAKALSCDPQNKDGLLFGYDTKSLEQDLSFDGRDNTPIAPRSVVVDDAFDWGKDNSPRIPVEKLIIYETHLKGFTAHPSSGVKHPGTYLGFIEKIPYLKKLGINAVELLPVHSFYKRDGLVKLGLTDYWGYNTVGFFAPERAYSSGVRPGDEVKEFKALVKALHGAGIEVILDVVFNHTGEGDELGPTLCFRGIDNPTYYALKDDRRYYVNDAGCGNTFNVENPNVLRFVLDALRYWAVAMRVDGFRFDLASILPRVQGRYSKQALFFELIADDPILKDVKLIAEPWDLTTYQVGNFPMRWAEWNGRFRDNARKFIKGDWGQAKEMSYRLTGSPDIYGEDGRTPYDSINFITCHDGFTLNDLYSYNDKHNEANGENNKDGTNENFSWNCGVEGPTDNVGIVQFRKQMVKNAFCCLLIPLGTPMINGGDEFLRSLEGNNNAYCQDNALTWFDWDLARKNEDITEFVRKLIEFRKRHPILQRRKFLPGQGLDFEKVRDLVWFNEDLGRVNWDDPSVKTFCCHLYASEDPVTGAAYHLFFILNVDHNNHSVRLPQYPNTTWYRAIDTSLTKDEAVSDFGKEQKLDPADFYLINARSVVGLVGIKGL